MYISSPRWCTSPLTNFDCWCVVSALGAAQVHCRVQQCTRWRASGGFGCRCGCPCNHAARVPVHVVCVLRLVSVPRQSAGHSSRLPRWQSTVHTVPVVVQQQVTWRLCSRMLGSTVDTCSASLPVRHGFTPTTNNKQHQPQPTTTNKPQTTTNNKQQTTNHHKSPQKHQKPPKTTQNHRKPPQTTANHRKPPQTTANHRKPPQTTTTTPLRGPATVSCYTGSVEVQQLVRYFPQVQFLDKVDDCPLLCSLGFDPDSAVLRSSGQGC